jgi:hypothetical protein
MEKKHTGVINQKQRRGHKDGEIKMNFKGRRDSREE